MMKRKKAAIWSGEENHKNLRTVYVLAEICAGHF
jgi:hypothetical protein